MSPTGQPSCSTSCSSCKPSISDNDTQFHSISSNCLVCTFDPSGHVSKFDFPKLLKSQNRVFGCSRKFSKACNHHGCSGTRRSESSSS